MTTRWARTASREQKGVSQARRTVNVLNEFPRQLLENRPRCLRHRRHVEQIREDASAINLDITKFSGQEFVANDFPTNSATTTRICDPRMASCVNGGRQAALSRLRETGRANTAATVLELREVNSLGEDVDPAQLVIDFSPRSAICQALQSASRTS